MPQALVGRDEIFARCRRSLGEQGSVLVSGPAGIGKTAPWLALVAEAADSGSLVLSYAPTEAESALPYAALADLLRPLAGRLSGLP